MVALALTDTINYVFFENDPVSLFIYSSLIKFVTFVSMNEVLNFLVSLAIFKL